MFGRSVGHERVVEWLDRVEQPPTIEFILPESLLNSDLDLWTPSRGDDQTDEKPPPLGTTYAVTIRSEERMRSPQERKWTAYWHVNWNRCGACRSSPVSGASTCVPWMESIDQFLDLVDEEKACVFVCEFVPQSSDLTAMLEEGISMALWAREPMDTVTKDSIHKRLKRECLGDLPQILRKVRRQIWRKTKKTQKAHTGHLSLLWDDPHRTPKRWGKKDRSGRRAVAVNPYKK